MKITSLSKAVKSPFKLEAFVMHSSSTTELIHLILEPSQCVDLHSNPFDVVACLIFGKATLNLEGMNHQLNCYDVVELEKDTLRGFTNNGNNEARLLILKKF